MLATHETTAPPMLGSPADQDPTVGFTDRQMYNFFLSSRGGGLFGSGTYVVPVEDPAERNRIIADHSRGLIEAQLTEPEAPVEINLGRVRRMSRAILNFAATSVVKVDNVVNTYLDTRLEDRRRIVEKNIDDLKARVPEGANEPLAESQEGRVRRIGGYIGRLAGLAPQGKLKSAERHKDQLDDLLAGGPSDESVTGSRLLIRRAADRYLGKRRQEAEAKNRAWESHSRDVRSYLAEQTAAKEAKELLGFSETLDNNPEMRRNLTEEIHARNNELSALHTSQLVDAN